MGEGSTMIKYIKIDGYKCISHLNLNLRSLNLLTGMNSSGKSSVIQSLVKVFQEMNMLDSGISFGDFSELRNLITGSNEIKMTVGLSNRKSFTYTLNANSVDTNSSETVFDGEVIYMNADRIGVCDTYAKNYSLKKDPIGIHGQYTFDYLSRNAYNSLENESLYWESETLAKNLGSQVNYWLNRIIGYEITSEEISGTDVVKVSYRQPQFPKMLRPKNIGTGVSYVAGIIIAALSCKKNSLLIIENPEIHLHPAAQSRLASFFAFLAQRGVQLVIETHSDHIYNGLRVCVKRQEISLDNLMIGYFSSSQGLCKVQEIELDVNGRVKNQQEGLFDQFENDLDDLLGL